MQLKDYNPTSQLVVKRTELTKPKFPVFDAHIHIGALQMPGSGATMSDIPGNMPQVVQDLKDSGIVGVVNLKMFWGEPLKEHIKRLEKYGDFIHTFASVDVSRLEEAGFAAYVDDLLKGFKSMGIHGLKLWKNIGCTLKDSSGKYIRPDDDRLRPIWESAAKHKLLVLYHIADPVSFFTPVDEKNEFYESLVENPDWVFYGGGRYSFDELMEAQHSLMEKNPDTLFVIPHFGSYGENLEWVGKQLDLHPNMYIDISARLNLLGRQPYTARDFFIKYQDRILFGTDYSCRMSAMSFYTQHYRFLETYDEYFRPIEEWGWGQGRWNIYGLGLPDEVLKKVYFENAAKLLGKVGIQLQREG